MVRRRTHQMAVWAPSGLATSRRNSWIRLNAHGVPRALSSLDATEHDTIPYVAAPIERAHALYADADFAGCSEMEKPTARASSALIPSGSLTARTQHEYRRLTYSQEEHLAYLSIPLASLPD